MLELLQNKGSQKKTIALDKSFNSGHKQGVKSMSVIQYQKSNIKNYYTGLQDFE
jgi:hypothetical protein